MKLEHIRKYEIEHMVPALEGLLELAKAGKVQDLVVLYNLENEPFATFSLRAPSRIKMIGQLEIAKAYLLSHFEIDFHE